MKMVYVKKHVYENGVILAMCDQEVLGKKLVDDEKKIVLYVDPSFYMGELIMLEDALELLREAVNANLVGNNIVEAAIEKGLVHREAVLVIGGVKHAQIIMLEG